MMTKPPGQDKVTLGNGKATRTMAKPPGMMAKPPKVVTGSQKDGKATQDKDKRAWGDDKATRTMTKPPRTDGKATRMRLCHRDPLCGVPCPSPQFGWVLGDPGVTAGSYLCPPHIGLVLLVL